MSDIRTKSKCAVCGKEDDLLFGRCPACTRAAFDRRAGRRARKGDKS